MADIKRVSDLDIDQDLQFDKLETKIERVCWVLMLALLVAALIGLLGPGPLTQRTASSQDGFLQVQYYRFARYESPTRVEIKFSTNTKEQLSFWLNDEYLNHNEIERIMPEPESTKHEGDHVVYTIDTQNVKDDITVIFHLKTQHIGTNAGRVGIENGTSVTFNQFVYP